MVEIGSPCEEQGRDGAFRLQPRASFAGQSASDQVIFASPDNDFPTRIIYERDGDVLKARIKGDIGGQARIMAWDFRAAPLNTLCPA